MWSVALRSAWHPHHPPPVMNTSHYLQCLIFSPRLLLTPPTLGWASLLTRLTRLAMWAAFHEWYSAVCPGIPGLCPHTLILITRLPGPKCWLLTVIVKRKWIDGIWSRASRFLPGRGGCWKLFTVHFLPIKNCAQCPAGGWSPLLAAWGPGSWWSSLRTRSWWSKEQIGVVVLSVHFCILVNRSIMLVALQRIKNTFPDQLWSSGTWICHLTMVHVLLAQDCKVIQSAVSRPEAGQTFFIEWQNIPTVAKQGQAIFGRMLLFTPRYHLTLSSASRDAAPCFKCFWLKNWIIENPLAMLFGDGCRISMMTYFNFVWTALGCSHNYGVYLETWHWSGADQPALAWDYVHSFLE